MLNWDSRYLCHFSTEMAEIWSPGTSFQDVWTCKISALYLLYFHSCESCCGVFSDFHYMFHNFESTREREQKFCMSEHLEKMCLETKFQPFRLRNDKDIDCPSST